MSMGEACRQLELVNVLPLVYGNGLATSLPCPPALLVEIIMVNSLRARSNAADNFQGYRVLDALDLLQRIRSFSVEGWSTEIKVSLGGGVAEDKFSTTSQLQHAASWDWQYIAAAFQSAVALYCISSLLQPEAIDQSSLLSDATGTRLSHVRESVLATLLCNLRYIATGRISHLRKLVLWPLVIGGIEIDPTDEASKAFILGELAWVSANLGITSPLVAIDFLKRLWCSPERSCRVGKKDWWDELFDRPYVFAV